MANANQEIYPIGQWIGMVADERPDDPALIFAPQQGEDQVYSWRELDIWSNQLARLLEEYGVGEGNCVAIGLPSSPEGFVLPLAIWKLGAKGARLRAAMPPHEYNAILELAEPSVVVADWGDVTLDVPVITRNALRTSQSFSNDQIPIKLAKNTGTLATSGSTGKPKLIEYQSPAVGGPNLILFQERKPLHDRFGHSMIQLICGPPYHSGPAAVALCGYVEGVTTVLMERFEATRALDLIEQYKAHYILLVPLMMQRMLRVPDIAERDLSSIAMLLHNSAPCPAWVKEGWINLIGGDQIVETYAGSENIGGTIITGTEWLEHPGSVGKPVDSDLKILDDDGVELPAGDIGLIYLRPIRERRGLSKYIGVPQLQTTDDGFMTLGDLGWLDEDGYLYIADRRVDMIVTGGANVYPAEVEAVLSAAPGVGDVVVIGVSDKEWGRRVHAIIQPFDPANPPSESELDTRCREHLASYKVPKTYEYLLKLPRNAAGKIRRSALASERSDHH